VLRQRLWSRARIRHLKILVEVSESGSLHKAAEAMGISQPAVSNAIADIEGVLETPLFIRHARGVRATAAGAQVLVAARRMLLEVDRVAEQTAALHEGAQGVVRMAATGGAITGLLTAALPALSRDEPRILLQLQEADPRMMPGVLASGEVDLAVQRLTGIVPVGWRYQPLLADRFIVVAGPKHPLARARKVSVDQLRREPWFAAPIDSVALKAIDELFGIDKPSPPPLQIACRIPEVMLAMLRSTRQITLVPFSIARQFLEAGLLVELALDRELPLDPIGLLEPVDGGGEAAVAMARFLRRYAEQHP
jgi:DNA-binding transcriptional LysR family regulator